MAIREPAMVLDMGKVENKRRLMGKINKMSGLWEISMKPRRHVRSLSQNSYYHAAFVAPFLEWLREEWGDPEITADQAHIELKRAVLGTKEKVIERTGEVMELVPSSRTKDTWEFSQFLDKAAEFLARTCGIVVLPAEMYFETKQTKETKSNARRVNRTSNATAA